LKKLFKNETGATAIEYALIASLIAMAIVAVLILSGDSLKEAFQRIVDSF